MPEIGATLREARMRERIDVSEIEATTKIRAKYLRALENEEWGLLPGPTFVKSFLRTYAQALDLDAKALVEEYRLHHERPSEAMLEPIVSTPRSTRGRTRSGPGARSGASRIGGQSGGRQQPGDGSSRGFVIAVSVIGVVIVVLIVLLISGGGSPSSTTTGTTGATTHGGTTASKHASATGTHRHVASSGLVALSLRASAVVYVCLIGDDGRKAIPGTELQPGQTTPTYHAKRFELTLGNSSVTMFVDGTARTVAPSSEPIGYAITKVAGRRSLPAGHLPTCT